MKLRNMIAYVTEEPAITIELANGEVLNLETRWFFTAILAVLLFIVKCASICFLAMITA